ncbi:hypothetical protein [Novosphingobium guangzhouense]|uniref:Uncharacterized protein n=1 Tax=Novosphingobium guangzhouense TaxID=1850347 RepID=A0A2K2G5Y0_9SPHN|nr:hypothetical protein [Novosphingobium guangzhouense]PNU06445.1 hypothetical protein A8V01_02560 [Novosphingobium guangzhouense]
MTPQTITPDDEAMAEFLSHLSDVQARRAAGRTPKRIMHIDGARVADAFRAKPRRAERPAPTRQASSPAPCPHCNTRGNIGCEHFLPYRGGTE